MSDILWNPDEWEPVSASIGYGILNGASRGSRWICWRRRPPNEVARIRAEKQRVEEDAVLARADAIRNRRAHEHV